ncbi:three-Cys-motif partner protein TcmP [Rhodococcus sp. 105337]|uniref:three-Cys-motif partner protein TcmP n=1 Tax=Rhodococcus sp. 105337 TaxID=2725310 RepID=UPI00146EBFFF|nr:three-Cys-motif partner protein TcmP [Rhodococcus sp. 105337]NME80096.1 three-Cys-motif partner protein TcmP [Rhodococcus sp. 105337]
MASSIQIRQGHALSQQFHKSKKSAAVLKHAIIKQYAMPFASKTGSTSTGNRVAFIDGYAGPGRYDDGAEGSGAMLLKTAHDLAAMRSARRAELHFVEQDPDTVARLRSVVADEGSGLTVTVSDGDVSTHLPALLDAVDGIPLFAYLDPCGLIIPMDEVVSIFNRPGSNAPTEVLINLTAHLRRFAGMLTSDKPVENSLKRIDDVCGGDWWRYAWLDKCPNKVASEDDKAAAEQAVVEGYAQRLAERIGGAGTWVIDVRPRADLKPVYYLVFATRHIDGLLAFGESASLGLQEWRKYHAKIAADGTLFGGDWEANWKAEEARLKAQWVDTIADRLINELGRGKAFRIIDRPQEILGEDLVGVVRTLHLRAAIKKVLAAGKTSTDPKGKNDLLNLLIEPV